MIIKHRGQDYTVTVCDGEAHGNGFIDNCSNCAPSWGVVVRHVVTGKAPRGTVYGKLVEEFRKLNKQ